MEVLELVRKVKEENDSASFTKLKNRLGGLFQFGDLSSLSNYYEFDDWEQVRAIGLLFAIRTYDADNVARASFETYARRCVFNTVMVSKYAKMSARAKQVALDETFFENPTWKKETPTAFLVSQLFHRLKTDSSKSLLDIVKMKYEGNSDRAISEAIGVSKPTVGNRLRSLRPMLENMERNFNVQYDSI